VEQRIINFSFCEIARESPISTTECPPSYFVSLVLILAADTISTAPRYQFPTLYKKYVRHCVERTIAGRTFVIEVTWVAEKRWRAHIVRIPGIPAAMMPFYGETADEAATNLSQWLDRAHQHQANTV
jgi:predicted RNase H-like HicB family nuclease